MNSAAARTNLSSQSAQIHQNEVLGEGAFRTTYAATYTGGNRHNQEAVSKVFKPQYQSIANEFFRTDFKATEHAIRIAEKWNAKCFNKREITINYGDIKHFGSQKCLLEPLIRYFTKYTSNNGYIEKVGDHGDCMEAFAHFSYHASGGQTLVCDLQGRYRYDRYKPKRCRYELTDIAVCSRNRSFGPTDMGLKGIETFFHNHVCNGYCSHFGDRSWAKPARSDNWFESHSGTSMLSSSFSSSLKGHDSQFFTYNPVMQGIVEEDEDGYY